MSVSNSSIGDLTIGRIVELACLLEVTASKPGNVHRGADFEDVTFLDFATSAVWMGQAIDDSAGLPYGRLFWPLQGERSRRRIQTRTWVSIFLSVCWQRPVIAEISAREAFDRFWRSWMDTIHRKFSKLSSS